MLAYDFIIIEEFLIYVVPFVATPLKGRFVVFSKLLLIGYVRLGYIG